MNLIIISYLFLIFQLFEVITIHLFNGSNLSISLIVDSENSFSALQYPL